MVAKILERAQTVDQTLSTQKDATPATLAGTLDAANTMWLLSEDDHEGVTLMMLPSASSARVVKSYLDEGYRFVTQAEYNEVRHNSEYPH